MFKKSVIALLATAGAAAIAVTAYTLWKKNQEEQETAAPDQEPEDEVVRFVDITNDDQEDHQDTGFGLKAEEVMDEVKETAGDAVEAVKDTFGETAAKAAAAVAAVKEVFKDKTEDAAEVLESVREAAEEKAEQAAEAVEELKEAAAEKVEEIQKAAEEKTEDAAETAEELTEAVEEAAEEVQEAVEEKAEELTETLEETVEEVQEAVEEKTEEAAETVEELQEAAEEKAEDAAEAVEELQEAAEEKAEEIVEAVEEAAEETPAPETEEPEAEEVKPVRSEADELDALLDEVLKDEEDLPIDAESLRNIDLGIDLPEEQLETAVAGKPYAPEVEQIAELYQFLDKDFIEELFYKNSEFTSKFPVDTLIRLSHKCYYSDTAIMREFERIAVNNGYAAEELNDHETVVSRKMFTEEGSILSDIFNVANQVEALRGSYEGYRID